MAKNNETSSTDLSDGLALLPDLADEPLDAPWLRRGITTSSETVAEAHPTEAHPTEAHPTVQHPTVQTPVVEESGPGPTVQPQHTDDESDESVSPRRKRSRRRRVLIAFGILVVLLLVVGGGTLAYAQRQFDAIERVEVAGTADPRQCERHELPDRWQ